MARRHIFFDKTEIIVAFPEKKKFKTLNLTYDQITRIQFERCNEFKLFRKVPSEKIIIITPRHGQPIEYTKIKEKKFFNEYKSEFERFAKDNKITFINNL